jgi:hypothetical protein
MDTSVLGMDLVAEIVVAEIVIGFSLPMHDRHRPLQILIQPSGG